MQMQIESSDWMKSRSAASKAIVQQFCDTLDYQLNTISVDMSDAKLVFFNILRHNHFFLMCFNFLNSRLQVIDNKSLPEGVPAENKYEDCPKRLLTAFSRYLHLKKNPFANKIKNMKVEYLEMPWKNEHNVVDCGIYSMRHMETYRGTPIEDWNSGFTGGPEDDEFIASLRAKYAANIIMWPVNTKLKEVTTAAKREYKKSK